MADEKLSALTELAATPDVADEFYVRDESEDPATESKRITYANLVPPTGRSAAYVIEASDAHANWSGQTDDLCDGTADQTEINTALTG